jgi:hypothetical protein
MGMRGECRHSSLAEIRRRKLDACISASQSCSQIADLGLCFEGSTIKGDSADP